MSEPWVVTESSSSGAVVSGLYGGSRVFMELTGDHELGKDERTLEVHANRDALQAGVLDAVEDAAVAPFAIEIEVGGDVPSSVVVAHVD